MNNPASADTLPASEAAFPPAASYFGLAPFLRMSIAGFDFTAHTQAMIAEAQDNPDDAMLWMNLSTAMMSLKHEELGLTIQDQALAQQRIYVRPAAVQPAKLRLLMLVVPGNLSANVPIDCLLENSDVDLIYYFMDPHGAKPLAWDIPEHDLTMVAVGASDDTRELITRLEHKLADWPTPVINAPQFVFSSERNTASLLLQNVPGLQISPALHITRTELEEVAAGSLMLSDVVAGHQFPIILRPVGTHGGHGLQKLDTPAEVATYLTELNEPVFFLSQFIDYSGDDGQFRKFRVVLIDGKPYACHMGISSHWMIHYVNAGMYEDAAKRAEEAVFLNTFADFAERHKVALDTIYQRSGLDYLGIDCAETKDGQFLVFEIDPAMVIHAMDDEVLFPNKQIHMSKVINAFRNLLLARVGH